MNQHRLGIVPHPRRKIWQRHKFQYRTCGADTPFDFAQGRLCPRAFAPVILKSLVYYLWVSPRVPPPS
jgi:hypothetical protein